MDAFGRPVTAVENYKMNTPNILVTTAASTNMFQMSVHGESIQDFVLGGSGLDQSSKNLL